MTLGERLVALRTQRGLSQESLAEQLGVTRQSVSKWETDASLPDLEKLVKLSEVFAVSLDQLVKGESAAQEQTPVAQQEWPLWNRICQHYGSKGYLLGWILVAWGILGLLKALWNVVVYVPVGGLTEALQLLFIAMLPVLILNLAKMLFGALLVLWGKRRTEPIRWYHWGWGLLALGLFGNVGPLHTGILQVLLYFPLVYITQQSPEEIQEYWFLTLRDGTGCLLLCIAGILMLVLGRRRKVCR